MNNALKQIPLADRERVSARVRELEKQTDAEVVCAVATESGRYDRAESVCGLLVGLLLLISGNKIAAMGDWDPTATVSLGVQVCLIVVGFLLGSVLASYWHGLRRWFVWQQEIDSEVTRSVHQVFSQHGIGATRHRGGMLIYLSLFERRMEIRCDASLSKRVAVEDLESIREAVLKEVRRGRVADGLVAGLDRAEETLIQVFPRTEKVDEACSNEVLVFHPRP